MKRPINVQPEVKAYYLEIQMRGEEEEELLEGVRAGLQASFSPTKKKKKNQKL